MRKKREFVEGVVYHVTSRTNDKKRVFGVMWGDAKRRNHIHGSIDHLWGPGILPALLPIRGTIFP
jgi:hypothetical protein